MSGEVLALWCALPLRYLRFLKYSSSQQPRFNPQLSLTNPASPQYRSYQVCWSWSCDPIQKVYMGILGNSITQPRFSITRLIFYSEGLRERSLHTNIWFYSGYLRLWFCDLRFARFGSGVTHNPAKYASCRPTIELTQSPNYKNPLRKQGDVSYT